MRHRHPLLTGALCAALLAGAGCATGPSKYALSSDELRREVESRLGKARAQELVIPFETSPELLTLARHMTQGAIDDRQQIEFLAHGLSDPTGLALRYDRERTAPAEQILERGGGDCLSLTALFIGMARSISLEVYFIDARGVQEFSREGSMLVDRRHVVAGWGKPPIFTMVDFNRVGTGNVFYRMLSDVQALARFYNNYGFDALRRNDVVEAEQQFRIAIKLDPSFPAAYNNLGLVLARQSDDIAAEVQFRTALRLEPSYPAALLNLTNVLRRTGRTEEAERLQSIAGSLRLRDPVWRLQLGLDALQNSDWNRAVNELTTALALDPSMTDGWFALARAYEAQGNRRRALRAVERVLETAPQHEAARAMRDRLVNPAS